jgi:septal ring factor EnvC (AmiA/AmiB activator)
MSGHFLLTQNCLLHKFPKEVPIICRNPPSIDHLNKHKKGGFTLKKKMMTIGIVFLFLALAAAAWAGPSDQIRGRMNGLQQRIDEGVRSGTLTAQEAKRVQNQLNSIRRGFDSAVQNGLSDREAKQFNQSIDTLNKEISKEKHDREDTRSAGKIDRRISDLQKQIDSGSRSGSLTPLETKNLQSRLDGIRSQYERAQKDGRLSDQEIRSIQTKLDTLTKSIAREKSDRERSR